MNRRMIMYDGLEAVWKAVAVVVCFKELFPTCAWRNYRGRKPHDLSGV
jgi:hypothetical protein